ncbi:MAG: PKD domain-containing protein [Thiotrichales bacterium]
MAQTITVTATLENFCSKGLPSPDWFCQMNPLSSPADDHNNNGIADIYESGRTLTIDLLLPEAGEGYQWNAISDGQLRISMFGDLDSDPLPPENPAELDPNGYYDPEWMDVDVEGFSLGRIIDGNLDNDLFNFGVEQDWWGAMINGVPDGYDRGTLWGGEGPEVIYGDALLPADAISSRTQDGVLEFNFALAHDHNDLTGHPYFDNREEFITIELTFEAERVPAGTIPSPEPPPGDGTPTDPEPETPPDSPPSDPPPSDPAPSDPAPSDPPPSGDGEPAVSLPTDDIGASRTSGESTLSASEWDHSFLRFDVSGSTPVETATLRLYVLTADDLITYLWPAASDDWDETGGWPEEYGYVWLDTPLAQASHAAVGYIEFDVTDFVRNQRAGDGIASFEVSNNASGWKSYGSRESAHPPELLISGTSTPGDPTANQPPSAQATISPQSGTAPLTVNFDASSSTDSDGAIVSYQWQLDGVEISTSAADSTSLDMPGQYSLKLTVTDNAGATASLTTPLEVLAPDAPLAPDAAFTATPTTGVAPLEVSLSAADSSDPDGQISAYRWDFGDGATGSDLSTTHSYDQPGSYTITLTVEDDSGLTATATRQIIVNAPAQPEDPPPPSGGSSTVTRQPLADIGAARNGSSSVLSMNEWDHSFLRFDVSGSTPVETATLRLYVLTADDLITYLWPAASDDWDETGGWPEEYGYVWLDTPLAQASHAAVGYIEFDVTDFVRNQRAGDGIASFEVSNNASGWKSYASRESINPPELIITDASGPGESTGVESPPVGTTVPIQVSCPESVSATVGQSVTLSCSIDIGSTVPVGTALSWSVLSAPVSLSLPESSDVTLTFTPPVEGEYILEFQVDDGLSFETRSVSVVVSPLSGALRILPLGNSITQSDQAHQSYRYPLWTKLIDAGLDFDFIGTQNTNFGGTPNWPDHAGLSFDPDHEGHWGWRADEVLSNLDNWLAGYAGAPDLVLLHLGTNDLSDGESVESTLADLEQIIASLRSANASVRVLIAKLIPTTRAFNTEIDTFNSSLDAFVASQTSIASPVVVVDQNEGYFADSDNFDGVHPNESGKEKMAQKWFDALVTEGLIY